MSGKRDEVRSPRSDVNDPYAVTDAIRLTLDEHLQGHLEGVSRVDLREFVQEGPTGLPCHTFGLVVDGVVYTVELTKGRR